MTKSDYQKGLQAEIKAAGFTQKITTVRDTSATHNYKTIIEFDKAIDHKLFDWLNTRFVHGVTKMDDSGWVMVNSPNEGTKYLPGTYVTITKGALTNAVGVVNDKTTVSIGSSNFMFDHNDYRLATPQEVMNVLLKNSMIVGVKAECGELIIKTNGNYSIRIADEKIAVFCSIPNLTGDVVVAGTNRF